MGSRKAVADRPISRATSCIHSASRGRSRKQTAAGLPANARSVKASTWRRSRAGIVKGGYRAHPREAKPPGTAGGLAGFELRFFKNKTGWKAGEDAGGPRGPEGFVQETHSTTQSPSPT